MMNAVKVLAAVLLMGASPALAQQCVAPATWESSVKRGQAVMSQCMTGCKSPNTLTCPDFDVTVGPDGKIVSDSTAWMECANEKQAVYSACESNCFNRGKTARDLACKKEER